MWESEESWYFPELTRDQAKSILQGTELGTFLVRVSGSARDQPTPGPVLSVSGWRNGAPMVIHWTIDRTVDNRYTISNQAFPTLHAILLHYRLNPLTDDGNLRLTSPADVRYFAKNEWSGSEEFERKVSQQDIIFPLMPVHCGQILRLVKRKPLPSPVLVADGSDAKLWCMENEQGEQGLVPSTCLLVFVRSEYESFMQRQRQPGEKSKDTLQAVDISSTPNLPVQTPPPPVPVSRPQTLSSPFSDRRLGLQSEFQAAQAFVTGRPLATDKIDMPSHFPAKAVAILDRNPNFYDRTQLRFRKGDILTVYKPATTSTFGVEDSLAYGWSEASIDDNGRKGLVPLFSAYIKWL